MATAIRWSGRYGSVMIDSSGPWLLQTADPTSFLELPGTVRGPIVFVTILVLGSIALVRYGEVVDRTLDSSMDRPLRSLGYGIAAHATLAFAGAYLTSQLAQLRVSGQSLGSLGIWVGILLLVVAAALGFTVVGVAAVELGLARPRWQGLLAGAVLAGTAGALDPLVGGLIWIVVVSTGIGGPVRSWVWAAEDARTIQNE